MKDRNDDIAVNQFKESIDDNINYIIDIAYTAGRIAGMKDQIENATTTCKGCVHYDEDDRENICFDCQRMIREDFYEVTTND